MLGHQRVSDVGAMNIGRKRRWRNVVLVVGVASLLSIMGAQSKTIQPDLPSFGMVGIAPASQFVRLNVSNVRVAGLSFLAPPGTLLVGPCTASLIFSDDHGKTLKQSDTHLAPGTLLRWI